MRELKPLLIPEELHEALSAEAASAGLSVEAVVTQAVTAHLDAIKTRKILEARAAAGSHPADFVQHLLSAPKGDFTPPRR
jgi:plasmid stability protein